ncbi:hypothetical protein QEH59_00005 [Coraliomargarita sp. SDUM461004]|uniref:MarR family transcriptional regulator n=1 Tax=Thalassobacterium sedimentorum TaxID=3041258 RepID=A0ABU1AE83_9BACT|nr:hypothetical protein [Coraliomargarita sp. SDUM461004]MDQ8192784.1 hypothetical protein [Coraliomargarita sp. SDUM461004]
MIISKYQRLLLENLAEDMQWMYDDSNSSERRTLKILERKGLVIIDRDGDEWCVRLHPKAHNFISV